MVAGVFIKIELPNSGDRANLLTDAFRQKAAEALVTAVIKALNESVE